MVCSRSALIFSIIKQYHLLLVQYLSHHIELIAVEKFSLYIGAINCCNKIKHNFSSLLLKTNTSTEIKSLLNGKYLFLLKNFLEFPQHIHNQTNI